MAEWSIAHDSKSCYGKPYRGSNPFPCASEKARIYAGLCFCDTLKRAPYYGAYSFMCVRIGRRAFF